MVQAISPPLTFDDFVALYREDGGRYELRNGVITEMRPIGADVRRASPQETEVISLIRRKLDFEIERLDLPYLIPQSCLVKPGPTVWVYRLIAQEYESGQAFHAGQRLISPIFPELVLTVDLVVAVGNATNPSGEGS